MWPFRRRRTAAVPAVDLWYPGIALRISTPNGEIVLANSDELYAIAKYSGAGDGCSPACSPGCLRHGWLNLVAGGSLEFGDAIPSGDFSVVPLRIEVKPMRLAGYNRTAEAEAAADA